MSQDKIQEDTDRKWDEFFDGVEKQQETNKESTSESPKEEKKITTLIKSLL